MEQVDTPRGVHAIRFALAMLGLALIGAGLCVGLAMSLWSGDTPGPARQPLAYVAWVCLALLGCVLILMVLLTMRHIRRRWLAPEPPEPVEHPDAWEVAGQRMMPDASRGSSGRWRAGPPDDSDEE